MVFVFLGFEYRKKFNHLQTKEIIEHGEIKTRLLFCLILQLAGGFLM
jgi:hypothetical protein